MLRRPGYGLSLLATVLAGIAASFVMLLPSWLWSAYVVDVAYDSIVGRGEGLDTWDRILLYGGNLALVFLGFVVYAWMTASLYRTFQRIDPPYWDVFMGLLATAIVAAIVAYFLPFVGIVIAIFAAPFAVNGLVAGSGPQRGGMR